MDEYLVSVHWELCSNKAANENVPNAPPPASNNVIGNVVTNVIKGLLRSERHKMSGFYTL